MYKISYPNEIASLKEGSSGFSTTTSGLKRLAIFICKDYKLKNKKELDNTAIEKTQLCGISLYLPGGLTESFSQDWGMATPLSMQNVASVAWAGIKNKIFGDSIASFAQSKTGLTLVPAQELLYNGPQPRTITFTYDFVPLKREEIRSIKNIVSIFKRFQCPTKDHDYFYVTPPVWEIKFQGIDENEDSNFVTFGFKDRMWALTSVEVNYSPEGNFSAFHTGFPTKISMTLSFNDLIPLWRDVSDLQDPNDEMSFLDDYNNK